MKYEMKTVQIIKQNDGWRIREKDTGRVAFQGKTEDECFDFLTNQKEFAYQEAEEEGVRYIY